MPETNAKTIEYRGYTLTAGSSTRLDGTSTYLPDQDFCGPTPITSRHSQKSRRLKKPVSQLITTFQGRQSALYHPLALCPGTAP